MTVSGNSVSTLTDFDYLSKAIATVSPSGVNSNSYTPTNSPQSCPATSGDDWLAAATPLPPSPNESLCSCMVKTLGCVVSSSTNSEDYGKLFGQVCGYSQSVGHDICAGIEANATTGNYGAYSMCSASEQLSFAFDQYYQSQNSNSQACDFDGAASTQTAQSADSTCQNLMKEAGSAGTGTVSSSGPGQTGGSDSSSGSSSSGSGNKGAAAGGPVPSVQFTFFALAAGAVGATMLLL